jgi:CHAD domain-containing protein
MESHYLDPWALRFDVWPGVRLPALDALAPWLHAAPPFERRESTTWWDTADRRLGAVGAVVIDRRDLWWVVPPTSTGLSGRGVAKGPVSDPLSGVTELLAAYVGTSALAPLVTVEVTATVHQLHDGGGRLLAEVREEDVTVSAGDLVRRFAGISLVTDPDAPDEVRTMLAAGLGAAGATPACDGLQGVVGPPTPVAWNVSTASSEVATTLVVAISAIRAGCCRLADPMSGSADSDVHAARVGVRQARSLLRTFRRAFDEQWAERLAGELAWIGGELGTARDLQVLIARFDAHATTLGGSDAIELGAVVQRLRVQESTTLGQLRATLRSQRFLELAEWLERIALVEKRRARLEAQLRRRWRRADREVRSVLRSSTRANGMALELEPAALHRARIAVKRSRYAFEAASSVRGARRVSRYLQRVQATMGDMIDAAYVQAWCTEQARAGVNAVHALTLGRVIEREQRVLDTAGPVWRAEWAAARRLVRRRWPSW